MAQRPAGCSTARAAGRKLGGILIETVAVGAAPHVRGRRRPERAAAGRATG
ncbi:MAG: hypothetical protein MZW92_14350 [Comamonadaceae bacterium]|nr:hypothetical protein [Comamonadaceae bacterium]